MQIKIDDAHPVTASPIPDEHQRAQEIGRHRLQVEQIKRRARDWRLIDCEEGVLVRMRHALIGEIEQLEKQLAQADRHFLLYVDNGRPLDAEQALHQINRLTAEWEGLSQHLHEVDEALLERHLYSKLVAFLGNKYRLRILNTAVLVSIIVVVLFTLLELFLTLPVAVINWFVTVDTIICIFLLADFFLRLSLAEDRRWYLRRYWIDLVASIPFYEFLRFGRLIGLVRFLRFARLLRLLRLGRAYRMLSYYFRGLSKLAQTFEVNLLKRSMTIALALLFFGALSIYLLEGPRAASLSNLGQSLWWSFTTVVTGGFADLYNPETPVGRLLTVGLVLLGLTVTGIFTASLTSVLVVDDSTRIQENQLDIELHLEDLSQKLELLSGETNKGLIALETVAQALSNQDSREAIATVLAEALIRDFEAVQASVHLLNSSETALTRIAQQGQAELAPATTILLGEGPAGRVAARLLEEADVAGLDLEPETELSIAARGMIVVCPLVAGRRVLGIVHLVLPDTLARYYLYNRVPMTLAHHAAMAFYAAE